MTKTITLFLFLLWLGGAAVAQQNKRLTSGQVKLKTIRLHIDGFSKSKSGAV
jgi:hypothetical protein